MSIGEILRRAWSGVRSGGMWGFFLSMYAVMFAILGLAFGLVVALAGVEALQFLSGDTLPQDVGAVSMMIAVVTGAAVLLVFPVGVAMNGGLVCLSDEVACGRPARFVDGWRNGVSLWPKTFVVDVAVGAVNLLVVSVLLVPLILIVVATGVPSSGYPDANPGAIVLLCCGGGLWYVVVIAFSLVTQAWEALSVRFALLGGRSGGEGLSAGLALLRSQLKRVILVALTLFGISFALSLATQLVTLPLQFARDSGSDAVVAASGLADFVVSLASVGISMGIALFSFTAWSVFWRDLTGSLEVAAAPSAPVAVAPAAYPPAPPEWPPPPPAPPEVSPPAEPPSEPPAEPPAGDA